MGFLFIFSYLDLKKRYLSPKFLKLFFFFMILNNFFEFKYSNLDILKFFLIKTIIFFILFSITFLFYCLKIIGGGDGKVILISFLMLNSSNLNLLSTFLFFFIFSFYFTLYHLLKLFGNRISKKYILFNFILPEINRNSILQKIFFLSSYRLKNLSDLKISDNKRRKIIYNNIIFNFNDTKLQFFTLDRIPLILIISFSFITFLILLGFK